MLLANVFAQAEALAFGKTREQVKARARRTGWSTMQLGMIGLGRMGANMVRRLHEGGHDDAWSSTCRRKRWKSW
jgi:phosphoglycerate dehydrogenase-like enzyme